MAPTDADDQVLVEAARQGDRRAFQELYRRYERKSYAVAYGFLRNQEDALDVVQEAFIKVHRYLPKFEGQSSFYTWLYRITANLCIDQIRRTRRLRDVEYDDKLRHGRDADTAGGLVPLPPVGDPLQAVRNEEIVRAFNDCLDHLSDKHRAVIVMRHRDHMSYSEMADAMQCSKGTIMSRLFHARRNMQKLLRDRLVDVPIVEDSDGDSVDEGDASREAATP